MRFSLRKVAKFTLFVSAILGVNLLIWKSLPNDDTDFSNHGGYFVREGKGPDRPKQVVPQEIVLQDSEYVKRYQRSAKSVKTVLETAQNTNHEPATLRPNVHRSNNNVNKLKRLTRQTQLSDVFISVKTTLNNHRSRLRVLLDTWISFAKSQTYIFTDGVDPVVTKELPAGHVVNTNCSNAHTRQALCCKMSQEYDIFIDSGKRWFCHVDDDTYVNIPQLLKMLRKYNHTSDWYLGKPSLKHPIEVIDRVQSGQKVAFWFATGGAGFCISQALALKMLPYAGGGRLMTAGEQIRLPDDCTVGYIIDYLLHKQLTVIDTFHSHLEPLWQLSVADLKDQISFSYVRYGDRDNRVKISGLPESVDPTRFLSIHCHLNPSLSQCQEKVR